MSSPLLSVVIASCGEQHDLLATLRSLATQTDVACDTIVIDDAAGEVAAIQRAIDDGDATFITFVRAGDVLLAGALRAMLDAMADAPQVGMAHALWLPLDAEGRISRQAARSHAARLRGRFPPGFAHDRSLDGVQALPTFRRESLRACGGLSGTSLDAALRVAAGRMVARGEARLVPSILCATRRLGARGDTWRERLGDVAHHWLEEAGRAARRLVRAARALPVVGLLPREPGPYEMFAALLQRWSFDRLRLLQRRGAPTGGQRIAYVLWRYPTLSDTLIRRELHALRDTGVSLEVFALEPNSPPVLPDPSSPAGTVTYFGPESRAKGKAFILLCLRRQPWTLVRLWLFIVRHRYRSNTTWRRDRDVLYLAAQLASALAKNSITHVHSPWANQCALVSFAASRLLGVTFSVQARASEIHRSAQPPLVADRLRFAEFVITNSRYNERYLRSLLQATKAPPVHTIYEGVELHRFRPEVDKRHHDGPPRLLSVARLVEPKGLCHLLRACHTLRDRGVDFTCDIIGGPEPFDAATWVHLRKLHTELGLEPCVHFHGAQPFSVVLEALQRADVFVLACVRGRDGSHDITPTSIMEAMAMALPVVSTMSGGVPEIVDHEIDGLLVPPGDEHALAEAIERLLRNGELRGTLGGRARRKIEERFDIGRNIESHAALFRSLTRR